MSLLLTKTCEYAILVTIQQGRYFAQEASIKVETELDLKLPPSIDDLIPQKTTISTPSTKTDNSGNCTFNISLVYFVSLKQLQRLRKLDATTTLHIYQDDKVYNLIFSISEAKEVVHQSGHKLDQIYKFVSDKGAWCTIPNSKQQLKAGLFYVQMPDNNATTANTPTIQLRSPPPTPSLPKRMTNMNRKKKVLSILGSTVTNTSSATPKKKPTLPDKPPLRRAKSSLVDLNIEEIAEALKNMDIFSDKPSSHTSSHSSPSPPPPLPPLLSTTTTLPKSALSYHQIGKGLSQYTFYFRIVDTDHKKSIVQQQKKAFKRPFFSYKFLTNYALIPAASFSHSKSNYTSKSCYRLRGHLVDIQHWLDDQREIKLDYLLMDKFTKETVGQAKIPLQGIAFESSADTDKVWQVKSESQDVVASVTVRMGLVSGWHGEEIFEDREADSKRASSLTHWESLITHNKKMRHHSQSSVPTLSTSTCSTKSSSNVPSIHYIHNSRPASYFTGLKRYTLSSSRKG